MVRFDFSAFLGTLFALLVLLALITTGVAIRACRRFVSATDDVAFPGETRHDLHVVFLDEGPPARAGQDAVVHLQHPTTLPPSHNMQQH